ncbi:MAG TPA: hypothetical protein VNN20_13320 [Thermodesulfobacteriota bacterium]|nr:hypothetical protein [Thermodesulfobacteriota bacterium]
MSEKVDEEKEQEEKLDISQNKKPFAEPKLTFIEPKLTKHGNVTKTTTGPGFFGGFTPPPEDQEPPVG